MKTNYILLATILMLTACGNKTKDTPQALPVQETAMETVEQTSPKPFSSDDEEYSRAEPPSEDDIICEAIKDFILGKTDAVILSDVAIASLAESSWPEAQCSVDGSLYSSRSSKKLTVKVYDYGYKYECTCPKHGDKFVDDHILAAFLNEDKAVYIEGIGEEIPE